MAKVEKVFVGMSGGVDSSVAAHLLKEQGYEVVGIHLRCWNKDGCDEKEARDARLVADKLDIPYYVLDMEEEYKKRVVDYMIDGYRRGLTPNPDIMCNKEIKFGLFLDKAIEMGADFVATGHYAQVKKEDNEYFVYAGKDEDKDQSYFLWTLGQDQLNKTLFPIGHLKKSEVRKIAKGAGLHVADKKDSQGICFIGEVTLQEFLGEYLGTKEGKVLDSRGFAIGTHDGAHLYTIGQRHGLGVALNEPHYVAEKDVENNTIVLAKEESEDLKSTGIEVGDVKLPEGVEAPLDVYTRIRYRQDLQPARLVKQGDRYVLEAKEPFMYVAPGQSAVFYTEEGKLIGGGIIKGSTYTYPEKLSQ